MNLCVINDKYLRYKYTSVVADVSRIAVRILMPLVEAKDCLEMETLLTTSKLLGQTFRVCDSDGVQFYMVIAEHIFDKNSQSQWWKKGESVDFYYDCTGVNKGIIYCLPLSLECSVSNESKREYCKRRGYEFLASITCLLDKENLMHNDIVVITDVDGKLITNLVDESTRQLSNFEIKKPYFNITPTRKLSPNSTLTFNVEVLNNQNQVLSLYDEDVYITSDVGYLPKTKKRAEKGQCSFEICTLMVDSCVFDITCHSKLHGIHTTSTFEITD